MDNMTRHKDPRLRGLSTEFELDIPGKKSLQDGPDDGCEQERRNWPIASGPDDDGGCQAFRRAQVHHLEVVDAISNDGDNT